MRCAAEKTSERIRENKTFSPGNHLDAEVFYRKCTKACRDLGKALAELEHKQRLEQDEINDPTTQERDCQSWWSKRRKK